ncbi:MAG: phage major capsid protein [Alphaproteobacteria bacterium]
MEPEKVIEALDGYHRDTLAAIKAIDDRTENVKNRLDQIELNGNRHALGDPMCQVSGEKLEHKNAFLKWIRKPNDRTLIADLDAKAVDLQSDAAGGYAVPESIHMEISKRLRELNPIRSLARVISASTSDFKILVDINGTSSGWVGETDSRSETDTPQLEEVAPTQGIVYAYPKVTEEALQDILFNVEDWLIDSVSEELAIAESQAFITGNGTKKPTGFLNGSKVATGDNDSPARAFGAIQYIPTGKSDGFANDRLDSPPGNPVDALLDCVYSMKPKYRQGPGVSWLMNSATAGVIRKFKDGDGRYIWTESMREGEPARLLGYPVQEAEDMPDIGANAFPVAFANWRRAYTIVDRSALSITIDNNITTPGYVKFYVRQRVGGKLIDDKAIKLIKVATS